MNNLYNVSASPHIRSSVTTSSIMADVAIALMPACAFGIFRFGFKAFLLLLVSVATCVLTEYLYNLFMKKPKTPYECSAVVTGLLIGMNLPVAAPIWIPILGGVFAILVVKQLFGGLGQNFMNPALAARCFLLISFGARMASFGIEKAKNPTAGALFYNGQAVLDGVSSATPLAAMRSGESVSLFDVFFGFTGGVIGETCAAAILLGAIYLLCRKVISLRIPLTYIAVFAVFMMLFSGHGFDMEYVACQICSGGLMLGAFFMATDYVTAPVTPVGQIIYGALLGVLTGIFRVYGASPEGVSYAIIFGNLLVPLIEKISMPKSFGKGVKANA